MTTYFRPAARRPTLGNVGRSSRGGLPATYFSRDTNA
jgi:hypothetical protein